ncbi:unnamed protein product, partial [Oppiella nova]
MFNKIIAGSVAYVMLSFIVSVYAQACPPGWSLAPDNTCVIIGPNTGMTYGAALAYCKNTYGAHLITDKNSMKNTFLTTLFASANLGGSAWLWTTRVDIGDNKSTSFIWSDGDNMTMYNNFASTDPNNAGGNQICVWAYIPNGNQWYDDTCSDTQWSGNNIIA